jgi:SWI/SNF-related matrix-associated actin-dependent regulator 1 of chromatin subfamily A
MMDRHLPAPARVFALAALFLTLVMVMTSGVIASAAQASERADAAARVAATAEVSHRIGSASAGVDLGALRWQSLLGAARVELANASQTIVASAGKAPAATRSALQSARDTLASAVASGSPAVLALQGVFDLRTAEKKTTDAVAAWQVAETARIAAAKAAAERAAAEAAAAAAASQSWSSESSDDDSWTPSSASASAPAAQAPAAQSSRGPAANCGPCAGAALVPVVYDGVTSWGCP